METTIDTYKLSNDCSFSIAPGWGCNMFSWIAGGEELMYCPEDYPAAAWKITGGGNPLLFPAIGRTYDTSGPEPVQGVYRIYGLEKIFDMPSHGVLYWSKFTKASEERSEGRISVLYEATIPEKIREESYPFDLSYAQRYTLTESAVELEAIITNRGDSPAPAAFGYHPYFRVSNSRREGIEVDLPVDKEILLTSDTILPTGETIPAEGHIEMKPDIYYDAAYTGASGGRMTLIDRNAKRAIHVDCDDALELYVLYTPDGPDFVCIEPWTRGLGAFGDLNGPGWESGNAIPVVRPRETVRYAAKFSVEQLQTGG